MKSNSGIVVLIAAISLAGCKTSHRHTVVVPPPPVQELTQFAIVDSFGVDSGLSRNAPLGIDPYYDNGIFEIYWDVRYNQSYDFYLSVSPTSSINDSVTVYAEACGPGEICDLTGYAICQYTVDFTLGCADQPAVDIYDLFYEVPQTLHFFAEACDRDGCSYLRLPVTMY